MQKDSVVFNMQLIYFNECDIPHPQMVQKIGKELVKTLPFTIQRLSSRLQVHEAGLEICQNRNSLQNAFHLNQYCSSSSPNDILLLQDRKDAREQNMLRINFGSSSGSFQIQRFGCVLFQILLVKIKQAPSMHGSNSGSNPLNSQRSVQKMSESSPKPWTEPCYRVLRRIGS